MVLLWFIIPLFILYSLLIIYYWRIWVKLPEYQAKSEFNERVSVIIPARNEAANIGNLLGALKLQTYPAALLEIIVIDDDSEDETAGIVRQYAGVRLVSLTGQGNSHKKRALEAGIGMATGNLIITTDADCTPPSGWVSTIVSFWKEKKSLFIAAPVVIEGDESLVQSFQAMDFMVLQGITAAVVSRNKLSMCNGANLAYEPRVFHEVNGFSGIDHIASGDDMLLMHKVAIRFPGRVHYLKSREAMVPTQPVNSWRAFFQQRIRWASKARMYDDKRILPVLLLVYLFNFSFLIMVIAGCWDPDYWLMTALLWILKTLIELPFYISLAEYFRKEKTIKWFFFFQPLHIVYTIVSGLFGQMGSYEWKGRRVK